VSFAATSLADAGLAPGEYRHYGWLSALWAVIAGSIVALAPFVVIDLSIDWLHALPLASLNTPGTGWPWRVDGTWTLLADLGPLLVVATVVAGCVGFYVQASTGRPCARWPIVICAALVGWLPIAGGHHTGLLGISTGLGFLLMWWTTHRSAVMTRPGLPMTSRRLTAVAAAVVAVGLLAASLSYSVLHPARIALDTDPAAATLRGGVSELVPAEIDNDGPLPIRLLGISIPPSPRPVTVPSKSSVGLSSPTSSPGHVRSRSASSSSGLPAASPGLATASPGSATASPGLTSGKSDPLRVAAIEVAGPRSSGPTIDSLFVAAGTRRIQPGGSLSIWLRLRGPTTCAAGSLTLDQLAVRVGVAGTARTRGLDPGRLNISCQPAARTPAGRTRQAQNHAANRYH
jgi:hypothetical protein